ncbi:hypothetical protein DFS34DRAFT_654722 [Phlyctochytrium arcticum]|nr:hypothetical protein DFS34DRAFT_654722 [Phlyctochytrium arcticum]
MSKSYKARFGIMLVAARPGFAGNRGKVRSLEELSIAKCFLITSTAFGKALSFLENLRKLNVSSVYKLDDDCYCDIAEMCPLLEDLNLLNTPITWTAALYIIEFATKLASLNLSYCYAITISQKAVIIREKPRHVKIISLPNIYEIESDENSVDSYAGPYLGSNRSYDDIYDNLFGTGHGG